MYSLALMKAADAAGATFFYYYSLKKRGGSCIFNLHKCQRTEKHVLLSVELTAVFLLICTHSGTMRETAEQSEL